MLAAVLSVAWAATLVILALSHRGEAADQALALDVTGVMESLGSGLVAVLAVLVGRWSARPPDDDDHDGGGV